MKKTYTKKQIQEAIAYWEKQLKAGNYRKVDESLDRAKYEKIKNELMDELEMIGPVAMCRKLKPFSGMYREMAKDPDPEISKQYKIWKEIQGREAPYAKDIVIKTIESYAFRLAGGKLSDLMTTVNVDDISYGNGNLSFGGKDQNGRDTSFTFSRKADGTWGMRR